MADAEAGPEAKRDRLPWLFMVSTVSKTVALWFGIFMAFVGIWKLVDDLGFKKIAETPERTIYYILIGITLLSIGILLLRRHLTDLEQRSFRAKLEYRAIQRSLRGARALTWVAYSRSSYLRLVFARWRIENSMASMERIVGGSPFLPVRDGDEYLMSVFQNLVEILSQGMKNWRDHGRTGPTIHYDTLSSLAFWETVMRTGGRFLSIMRAAKENGMIFRRFILIDEATLLENRQYRNSIRSLLDTLKAKRKDPIYAADMRELVLEFAVCNIELFRTEHEIDWPYAVIHMPTARKSERMVVIPSNKQQKRHFDRIDVHFDKGEDHSAVKKYVKAVESIRAEHLCYVPSGLELFMNELDQAGEYELPRPHS